MINKKDPLIAAVQQVMQNSQNERNAVNAVNEKFGIQDRRVLPRERQAEWDAAYQQVLSEGAESLSPKQKKLAAIAGNPKKIDASDLAAARKGHASHIQEGEKPDEIGKNENEGGSAVTTAKPKSTSITPTQQDALKKKIQSIKEAKKTMCEGGMEKTMHEFKKGTLHSGSKTGPIVKSRKQAIAIGMNEATLESIQEEIANNLAEQASSIYESEGAEGLNTFLESLTEEQIAILQMNEGLWDSIKSAYNSVDSAVKSTTGSINRYLNNPQGIKSLPSYTPKTNDAISNMNKSTTQQGGNGTSGPNRGLDQSAKSPKAAAPTPKVKPTAPKAAAPKAAAPKAAVPKEQGTPSSRMRQNRMIDKGNEVGPKAKYQGVGVSTGKTIKK